MRNEVDLSKSKPISQEQIKKYVDTVGADTVSEIATEITERLQEACTHVGEVFCEMEQKFPEIMACMGFAAIATCNALPIEVEHVPVCVVTGTASGIQYTACSTTTDSSL